MRGGAGNGRFVHADPFRHILEDQGLHGDLALLQKSLLFLDDAL